MSDLLKNATATLNELLRIYELNQELLETLTVTMLWIREYAEKHNIPFPRESSYMSLINKAQTLIEEIAHPTKFYMNPKSDGDFTEPS